MLGVGRFASADTIVPDPQNPQSYNRYAYVHNRALNFSDPTGHKPSDGCDYESCTLSNGLNPNSTWQTADGSQLLWDPVAAAAQDYNPLTEAVLPATGALLGIAALPTVASYVAAEVIWPALMRW